MSVAIRLARGGSKGKPFYKVVVAERSFKRDGRFLEKVGTYNPKSDGEGIVLNTERINYWISKGAKPTRTVAALIKNKK
jgi:small subunit ribosomal protein S16